MVCRACPRRSRRSRAGRGRRNALRGCGRNRCLALGRRRLHLARSRARGAADSVACRGTRPRLRREPARVWVTHSGGARWEAQASFRRRRSWFWWSPAERPHTAYVQSLAVAPTDPDILLAGIEAGALVRSNDGGRTWSGHLRRASRDPHVVAFHPADGAWAYEGGGTGPAVSSDGGMTWRKVTDGLDRRYCGAVAADPTQPERWYVAAAAGPRRAHGQGHAGAAVLRAGPDGCVITADDLPAMPYLLASPAPAELVAVLANGEVASRRTRAARGNPRARARPHTDGTHGHLTFHRSYGQRICCGRRAPVARPLGRRRSRPRGHRHGPAATGRLRYFPRGRIARRRWVIVPAAADRVSPKTPPRRDGDVIRPRSSRARGG